MILSSVLVVLALLFLGLYSLSVSRHTVLSATPIRIDHSTELYVYKISPPLAVGAKPYLPEFGPHPKNIGKINSNTVYGYLNGEEFESSAPVFFSVGFSLLIATVVTILIGLLARIDINLIFTFSLAIIFLAFMFLALHVMPGDTPRVMEFKIYKDNETGFTFIYTFVNDTSYQPSRQTILVDSVCIDGFCKAVKREAVVLHTTDRHRYVIILALDEVPTTTSVTVHVTLKTDFGMAHYIFVSMLVGMLLAMTCQIWKDENESEKNNQDQKRGQAFWI